MTGWRKAFAPGSWGPRGVCLLVVGFLAWACWGSWDYRVTVPFVITPQTVVHFAAPFDGALEAAHVETGQQVRKGQVLFEMDTAELTLKRHELESDLEVARLESSQFVEAGNLNSAAAAMAKAKVIQAHLDTVRYQISQAKVLAPEDGIILSGDIGKRVGEVMPLGESLLEFAPSKSWAIELEIPEERVAQVGPGQDGTFVATARPGESHRFEIDGILPVAESRDGANVFLASTTVADNPPWMRAGMKGVATVDVGRRRVSWILFHRITNFLHLHMAR